MAGIAEMALGIASVLRSNSAPNLSPVDPWGVCSGRRPRVPRHLTDECADAGLPVRKIISLCAR